jgi:hypothetical protein
MRRDIQQAGKPSEISKVFAWKIAHLPTFASSLFAEPYCAVVKRIVAPIINAMILQWGLFIYTKIFRTN